MHASRLDDDAICIESLQSHQPDRLSYDDEYECGRRLCQTPTEEISSGDSAVRDWQKPLGLPASLWEVKHDWRKGEEAKHCGLEFHRFGFQESRILPRLACLLAQRLGPGGRPPEPRALALRFSPSLVSVIHKAQLFCGMARSHAHPMQHSQAHPRLGQSACAEPLFKAVFASFPDVAGFLTRGSGEKPLSENNSAKAK